MNRVGLLLACANLAACATPPPVSVYEQLGSAEGLSAIIKDYVYLMATDERIKETFAATDFEAFEALLYSQICDITGGPCEYTGRDMAQSHKGIGITVAEFNASVELLQTAMLDNGTPLAAQNRLLALLAPMQGDVIEK